MPERHPLVTLVQAQGARIRILAGRVWVAEEGIPKERPLEGGAEYVVAGNGRVVVEQAPVGSRGEMAEIAISYPCELPTPWQRALGRS
ncbi:MAG TPA: DUF2917 domain-containing protein [Usitatibacter sp.]|nr:DUF2917 domain-containing protein [Usitatibacter sp.]